MSATRDHARRRAVRDKRRTVSDRVHLLARIRGYTLVMRCGERRRSPGGIRYVDQRVAFEAWPIDERCEACAKGLK